MARRPVPVRRHALIAALIALLGASGCGFNLLTTQEEIVLGEKIAASIEQKATLYDDPTTVAYVQAIGTRITRVSDRQDVIYHVKVIDDHNAVNAFALPGGYIYLYTGLLRLATSEAELASVIAHETGHVAARHSAEHISAAIGMDLLLSVALGQSPGLAAGLGSEVLTGIGFSRMSQSDEYEADQLGVTYMKRAGYDPSALPIFLRRLDREHGRSPGKLAQFFATHPLTKDRIARAEQLATDLGRGGYVGADSYRHRLAHLMAEPAPPKKGSSSSSSRSGERRTVRRDPEPAPQPPPGLPPPTIAPDTATPPSRRQEGPMICRNLTKGNVVASRLELATTSSARRKGLLGRSALPPGGGLLLVPCNSVHTVRMKFAIDIVFLDKEMRVLRLYPDVKPGALSRHCMSARNCLELPSGTIAARRIEKGDQLRVLPAPSDDPGH